MRQLKHVKGLYQLVDNLTMGSDHWKTYVDSFLLNCQVKNLTDASINDYAERLGYLVKYLSARGIGAEDCTRAHLTDYIVSLTGQVSASTINGRIQCYKTFWKYLVEEGIWIGQNPAERLKKQRVPRLLKSVLGEDDLNRVLAANPARDFITYRNRVMLLMFFDTMIRRNELITLTTNNVDLRNGVIKVMGKGVKEREVPMGTKLTKMLHFYLERHRKDIGGDLVFCTHQGRALDKDNTRQIVWRMGRKVGVHLSPHLIRHSACTWFIRRGGSPAIAQRILGHTSPVITDRYTHLDSGDMVSAYRRLSPADSLKG